MQMFLTLVFDLRFIFWKQLCCTEAGIYNFNFMSYRQVKALYYEPVELLSDWDIEMVLPLPGFIC